MAPPRSLRTIGALVACGATAVQAATQTYQVSEEYTADNFFDKFDFFVSTYTSGDSWDATHGFVQYRSQAEAESLGLISTTSSGAVYIGPDTNGTYNATGTGRDSVRMTSKASYNQGLMIAEFSHMPAQACGAWPAFWSYGSPWLTSGEIDYYEGWNLQGYNRMAMHTNGTLSGACTLSTSGMTGTILTESCVNDADETGCGVEDDSGAWASATGATFAMEWTDDAIKVWSWVPSSIPSDIVAGSPVPSGWGEPTMMVQQDNCDLASSFANQQLVFDIDFCGDTAGSSTFWDVSCSALSDSCASYVAENPAAFADTYFVVESIKYYELGVAATTSAAVVSTTAVSVASTSASAVVTLSTSTLPASSSSSSSTGALGAIGSVLESTLGVAATSASPSPTSEADAVQTSTHSHSTGYVYATSVSTDELGSETTVVVTVDTTICPVTAAEASSSAAAAAASSSSLSSAAVVDAQTTTTPVPSATGGLAPPSAASSPSSVNTATSESSPVDQTSAVSSVQAPSSSSTHTVSTSLRTLTLSIPATAITSVSKTNSKSAAATTSIGSSSKSAAAATSIDSSSVEVISLSLYTSATGLITATSASATATTEVISSTDLGGGDALETASAAPTSISLDWLTAAATGLYSYNATGSGVASSTGGASAAKATDTCSGLDCIVVSSAAPSARNWQGDASTLALVAFAGIALLW